jgi:hypothetical protein
VGSNHFISPIFSHQREREPTCVPNIPRVFGFPGMKMKNVIHIFLLVWDQMTSTFEVGVMSSPPCERFEYLGVILQSDLNLPQGKP